MTRTPYKDRVLDAVRRSGKTGITSRDAQRAAQTGMTRTREALVELQTNRLVGRLSNGNWVGLAPPSGTVTE